MESEIVNKRILEHVTKLSSTGELRMGCKSVDEAEERATELLLFRDRHEKEFGNIGVKTEGATVILWKGAEAQ